MNLKVSHVHRLEDLILLRWQYSQIYLQIHCNPDENSNCLFCKNLPVYLKIHIEMQVTQRIKTTLKRINKIERFTLLISNLTTKL